MLRIKTLSFAALLLLSPLLLAAHGGEHGELIVRMTENGFEPKELRVTQGDEVLFINNDEVDRWPASNFHPTHTQYSEFDPQRGIPPGESWKFVFKNPGTWKMHDHLLPHMTGTIVVVADPTKATTTVSDKGVMEEGKSGVLNGLKNFFTKIWRKLFITKSVDVSATSINEFKGLGEIAKYAKLEEVAEDQGAEVAWQYVVETYETPEGVVGKAHDMAHLVGQLIYKEQGLRGLSICTPSFAFGCYHGLMQVAFEGLSVTQYPEQIVEAETSCFALGNEQSAATWSCIHGIGHGVITYREHNLEEAISDCELLKPGLHQYCIDGVFMELSFSAGADFYKKSDPLYPCNTLKSAYQGTCTRSQVSVMQNRFALSNKGIASVCLNASEGIKVQCIDAIGHSIVHKNTGNNTLIGASCKELSDEWAKDQCLSAAAEELVFQNTFNWQVLSEQICLLTSPNYRTNCFQRVERTKKDYGRK